MDHPPAQIMRAALWMTGAIASFSAMAVAGREVSFALDTFEIMLYRSIIGLLIVTIIPVVNVISPPLWLLFGAWMMALQYADYAADNNDVPIRELLARLRARRFHSLMFGLPAYLLLTLPVVNLILMPVGVAGGTRFWVEKLR